MFTLLKLKDSAPASQTVRHAVRMRQDSGGEIEFHGGSHEL